MNIVNNTLLKAAMLPTSIYKKFGVNTAQLQTIVATKLLIDDRRPSTFQQISNKSRDEATTKATLYTMFISALFGMFYLISFAISPDIIAQLTFFFSFFMVMLAATLITDFTSVLTDVRDNTIILSKPVNDKTVVVARLLHILIHICKILLPMVLPAVVYLCIEQSIAAGLVLFVLSFFVTLLVLLLINAVYILILRFTTPQKFQAVISYFQIVFAFAVYASYMLLPRTMGALNNVKIGWTDHPLLLLAPPYWFAVAWHTLYTLSGDWVAIALTIAGFLIPVLSVIAMIKYFAPTFNKKLTLISSSDTGICVAEKGRRQPAVSYAQRLAMLFTKTGAERTGFLFTWKMADRSKDFKLKVYPGAGYIIVYLIFMYFNLHDVSLQSMRQQTGQGRTVIVVALYVSSFLVITALNQMIFSDKYKAAWMFHTTPVAAPGTIISGAVKSMLLKFYFPVLVVVAVTGFSLIGVQFLPSLLLAVFNVIFVCAFSVYQVFKALPFSRPQNVSQQSGSFMKNLLRIVVMSVLGVIHYLLYPVTPVIIILAILAAIAAWYMMDSISKISWRQLTSEDIL